MQIVLHAMLKLAKQYVLFVYAAFESIAINTRVNPHIHERSQPKRSYATLVLDEIGIDIDAFLFSLGVLEPECTDEFRTFDNCRTKVSLRTVAINPKGTPRFSFDFGGTLSCQLFEFRVGIDDTFAVP
ncbi:MAG TPA: hypothetical protein VHT03_15815 [Rhizomicrobium sp.]|nr:hypothetical protein [Rhizomicrobium sp.]